MYIITKLYNINLREVEIILIEHDIETEQTIYYTIVSVFTIIPIRFYSCLNFRH